MSEWRRRHKAAGLCYDCLERADVGIFCRRHSDARKAATARYHLRKRVGGRLGLIAARVAAGHLVGPWRPLPGPPSTWHGVESPWHRAEPLIELEWLSAHEYWLANVGLTEGPPFAFLGWPESPPIRDRAAEEKQRLANPTLCSDGRRRWGKNAQVHE